MPRIKYEERRFQKKSLDLIEQANDIIAEYRAQGFVLILRQLWYQFVSRNLLPNETRYYKRLKDIITKARMAGLIDWDAIEDPTRFLRSLPYWESPEEIVHAVADQFRIDRWADQPVRLEVWIEKTALIGVIENVCNEFRVPYFACIGFNSASAQWLAGRRFLECRKNGQTPIVLHLGDHDPSGIDMTRDNRERLEVIAEHPVEVRRLALNMDQIEAYALPPNPAKTTDTRYAAYIDRFGSDSWELDALSPTVISDLIRAAIEGEIDPDLWEASGEQEIEQRAQLRAVAEDWDEVQGFLGNDQ